MLSITLQSIKAQVGEKRTDWSAGFSAGYLMTKMDMQPTIKQTYKQSPTFGFATRYVCEKYFTTICAIQLELNYTPLGWKEDIDDGSGNTYSRSINYIQTPLLMQMGWGYEKRGCKFLFEAGPVLGFNISSKEHFGGSAWDTSNRPNNVTAQYGHDIDHMIDYGLTGGIGMELSTDIGHFLVEARYYYGLGDTFDNSNKSDFSRSAHQTISAKLTYLFDIVKTKQ